MTELLLFDLSDVLIHGLRGVEKVLSRELDYPEHLVVPCFEGGRTRQFFRGHVTEDQYLDLVRQYARWDIPRERLKEVLRENFRHEVAGAVDLLRDVAARHRVALISDHGREWIDYIRQVHDFFPLFEREFYSFDLKCRKRCPYAFELVEQEMKVQPLHCLFIDHSRRNIAAAQARGFDSVQFENVEKLRATLSKRGLV